MGRVHLARADGTEDGLAAPVAAFLSTPGTSRRWMADNGGHMARPSRRSSVTK